MPMTRILLTAEIGKADRIAALRCIAITERHFPLNEGEKRLLGAIINDIRLAFDLEGAIKPAPLQKDVPWAPEEWFW